MNRPLIACLLAWSLVGACPAASSVDPALPAYLPEPAAAGVLVCTRAESMESLLREWMRQFRLRQPEIALRQLTDTRFPTEAFPHLLDGKAEILTCPRELFPAEVAAFRARHGYDPLLIAVATGSRATVGGTHAIAIHVNAANPLDRLTMAQLREILSAGGRITTWGQLGLSGEWAAAPIRLQGMLQQRETGNPPGIVNFLEQQILSPGRLRDSIHQHLDQPGRPSLEGIVMAVAGDRFALGYSGFSQAVAGTKSLALAESDAGPFLAGSGEEIADRTYPLSRTVYLCVNRPPGGAFASGVREFLTFILSREGQQIVAADPAGFLPLTASMVAGERTKLR